jgi:triphosphatase
MEIDLVLDPDAAARFLRLSLFGAAQRGRPHQQRIVWHDSADGALTARGLALAQERGAWRLEKLLPEAADTWPPGAPPPMLAQEAEQEALGHELPTPLAPVVAFAGRRQTLVASTEQGPVAVTLLRGLLRAVTHEHPACRLSLSGDDRAVLQIALAIAETQPVEVATTTLAGAGLATARGTEPPPRRHGAPDLPAELAVADAFAFVIGHLADVLLHFAPRAVADGGDPEPVHQMRVALRRLRSAMKMFQPALDCDELRAVAADLKALNARLGPARDWDVFLSETLAAVQAAFPDDARLARLIVAAGRRRQEHRAMLREFLQGPEFRRLAITLAWLAGAHAWRLSLADESGQPVALHDFAVDMLERRTRKLRTTDDLAGLDAPARHAVRLKAKRARYAMEIFGPIFSGRAPHRFIQRLAAVQNLLGTLNDGTTAHGLLDELGGAGGRHAYAAGLVMGFVGANSSHLLPEVMRRWSKLHRTRSFWAA